MAKIGEIAGQNPWWTHGKEFVEYDKNLSEAKRSPVFFERKDLGLKKGNIYIIRGCRQGGKTTYLKEKIRKLTEEINPRHILYLSVDFFTSRRELRNALNYFLDSCRDVQSVYIFLDEVTALRDWNLELKYLADSGVTRKAPIIATGSSGVGLKSKGELLPGRGLEGNEYRLKPLIFREFVLQCIDHIEARVGAEFSRSLRNLKSTLLKSSSGPNLNGEIYNVMPFKKELEYLFRIYLVTGGFPRVINHHLAAKFGGNGELDPILAEIYVRDVLGDLAKQGKQEVLARQLLKEIMEKYGTRYSFSKIARDIEASHVTVIDYLDYLEQSFVLQVLYSYDFNKKDVKFKGDKKVYFVDPFVFHSLKSYLGGRDLNEVIRESLEDEESLSGLIEGVVANHLAVSKERPYLRDAGTFLWFYYDTRREVDFILENTGIEVKYRGRIDLKKIRRLPQIKNYMVLSKDEAFEEENISVVPVEVFLSLIKSSDYNL